MSEHCIIDKCPTHTPFVNSETDLDEVLQINNVFFNVSKGQACNSDELQKGFGKTDVSEIVKEVNWTICGLNCPIYTFRYRFSRKGSSRSGTKREHTSLLSSGRRLRHK